MWRRWRGITLNPPLAQTRETPRYFPVAVWVRRRQGAAHARARRPIEEGCGARTSSRSRRWGSIPSGPGSTGRRGNPPKGPTTSRRWTCCSSSPRKSSSSWSCRSTWTRPRLGSARSIRTRCSSRPTARRSARNPRPATVAITRRTRRRHRLLCRARRACKPQPGLRRMGSLERAARHQLGEPDLDSQPGVLFLPAHDPALPRVAAEEVRIDRDLNTAWYRRFPTWDDVEPSRMSTILSYTDYIDWKPFIVDKLGEDLRDRYQAVKTGRARDHRDQPRRRRRACSPRRITGKDRPTTGRWRGRWISTGRRSIRSIRRSSIATCRGVRRCSTSRGRSATTRDAAGSGSASCRAASARSR